MCISVTLFGTFSAKTEKYGYHGNILENEKNKVSITCFCDYKLSENV